MAATATQRRRARLERTGMKRGGSESYWAVDGEGCSMTISRAFRESFKHPEKGQPIGFNITPIYQRAK